MAAVDRFSNNGVGLTTPIHNAFTITPHDSNELSYVTRSVYVGGGGDIVAVMASGAEVTLRNVVTGSFLPYRIKQIKATGTTATDIIGGE